LICEVALAAVSRIYLFSTLGLPEPDISIEPDSIVIKSADIDYSYVIYYPKELNDEMNHCFSPCLLSLKREYDLYISSEDMLKPSGERVGEMLRRFKSLERLLHLVLARKCWNGKKTLALHGLQPNQFLSSLRNELEQADINYMILLPLNDELGSGMFKAIEMSDAMTLESNLRSEQPRAVENLLHLEEDYGPHTWVSNNHSWPKKSRKTDNNK